MTDLMQRLSDLAPPASVIDLEWSTARAEAVLAGIAGDAVGGPPGATEVPLRFVAVPPARRSRKWLAVPVAACVAAVAVGATALLGSGGETDAGSFVPPAGLSDQALPDGVYALRYSKTLAIGADGTYAIAGESSDYVDADGNDVTVRSGKVGPHGCLSFPRTSGPDLEFPTAAWLATLPTDVDRLSAYLNGHASGSTSHSEAVFVAVGDLLVTDDALASPRLRAALVAVLDRTPGVTLHQGARDDADRTTIRVDFVDQQRRPGEVHSYFFDPGDFRLVEEREVGIQAFATGTASTASGRTNAPTTEDAPSPAYSLDPPSSTTGAAIPGPGYATVIASDTVVDAIPDSVLATCHTG